MLQEGTTNTATNNLPFIKKDPRLTLFIKLRNVGFWFLGVWIVLLVALFVVTRIEHIKIPYDLTSLLNFPLYGFMGCSLNPLLFIPAYKKIEHKRQAAARGEQILLADQQPDTMLPAVSLPIIINYKPNNYMKRIAWALSFILVLLIAEMIWLGFSLSMTVLLALAVITYIASYLWLKWKGNYEFVADETGLTMKIRHLKKVQYIPWTDARLFAIETLPNEAKLKIQTPRLFELASQQEVIFWPGSSHTVTTSGFILPLLTDEQYTQQLQALHALIIERTGLTLHDLRK